jgi:hypothetical protein
MAAAEQLTTEREGFVEVHRSLGQLAATRQGARKILEGRCKKRMCAPVDPPAPLEYLAIQALGLRVAQLFPHRSQVEQAGEDIRMIGAEVLAAHLERFAVRRFRLRVVRPAPEQQSQAVEIRRHVEVISAVREPVDREGLTEESLGRVVLPLPAQYACQLVERASYLRVPVPVDTTPRLEHFPVQAFRRVVVSTLEPHPRHLLQARRDQRVPVSIHPPAEREGAPRDRCGAGDPMRRYGLGRSGGGEAAVSRPDRGLFSARGTH